MIWIFTGYNNEIEYPYFTQPPLFMYYFFTLLECISGGDRSAEDDVWDRMGKFIGLLRHALRQSHLREARLVKYMTYFPGKFLEGGIKRLKQ